MQYKKTAVQPYTLEDKALIGKEEFRIVRYPFQDALTLDNLLQGSPLFLYPTEHQFPAQPCTVVLNEFLPLTETLQTVRSLTVRMKTSQTAW